jgi:thiamine pyrophosphate-dependent acetolactate synthase large subunit-like protein
VDPPKWIAANYRSVQQRSVGTALGQANGVQALDRSRQVIALCGDGGFNMLMCEFLTAVHQKLPVKVVIYNNSAFGHCVSYVIFL